MSLVQDLKAARALISKPGTWTTGTQMAFIDGKEAYCAQGAINYGIKDPCRADAASSALGAILTRRYFADLLPKPKFSGGNSPPIAWAELLNRHDGSFLLLEATVIAQFNNSTSQAEVLALFDEAIAEAEGKPVVKEPEPTPTPVRVRELEMA